jgi:hypothetical protein
MFGMVAIEIKRGSIGEYCDKASVKRALEVKNVLAGINLNISQVFKLVKCSPVASCLGSSLPGRSRGRGDAANADPAAAGSALRAHFSQGVRNAG